LKFQHVLEPTIDLSALANSLPFWSKYYGKNTHGVTVNKKSCPAQQSRNRTAKGFDTASVPHSGEVTYL